MKKNLGIQGYKGLAAFFIAYNFHYAILYGAAPFSDGSLIDRIFCIISEYASTAEGVFFLVSGYFMDRIYRKRITSGEVVLKDFFLKKVRQIYPMMIVTVLIVWCLQTLGFRLFGLYPLHSDGGAVRYSLKALIASLLGISTGFFADGDTYSVNGPCWFIPILLLCYLIYFIILKLCKDKKSFKLALGLVTALGGYLTYTGGLGLPLLYECNGRGYFCFGIGVFISMLYGLGDQSKASDRSNKGNSISKHVCCIFILALLFLGSWLSWTLDHSHLLFYTDLFIYPSLLMLIMLSKPFEKVIGFKPFVWLGNNSLTLYMWNMPVLMGVRFIDMAFRLNLNYSSFWVWAMEVALALLICPLRNVIYTFCQKRITRL